ncbi:MAG: hypothetical protein AAB381_02155 [Patescibacteria group bacterium]
MSDQPFFNFSGKQIINQWLGISLISLMCFWTVLYYVVNKAQDVGQSLVVGTTISTKH